jgi:hypothetical protein
MVNSFDPKLVGNSITMTTTFYDTAGVKIQPDLVRLKYKKPNGELVSVTVSYLNQKYEQTVTLDIAGTWNFRWEGTGNYASAEEFQVAVKDSIVK